MVVNAPLGVNRGDRCIRATIVAHFRAAGPACPMVLPGRCAVSQPLDFASLESIITSRPYHRWLGLSLLEVGDGVVRIQATWREEFVVNPERRYTHGGILAALVDIAGDYAVAQKLGRPVPTIDMRVDFHKAAMPGNLVARGEVVRMGAQFSVADARVFDEKGALVASGRGVYSTAPLPAAPAKS